MTNFHSKQKSSVQQLCQKRFSPFLEEKISYVRKCGFFLKSRAYIKCLYELSFVCFVMGTYSNTLDTSNSILHWYMHIPIQLYPGLTETNFDDLIVLSVYAYMWRVQDKHMMCTGVWIPRHTCFCVGTWELECCEYDVMKEACRVVFTDLHSTWNKSPNRVWQVSVRFGHCYEMLVFLKFY